MKYCVTIILLSIVSFNCYSDDENLEEFDKEVLIQVINAQKAKISTLEQEVDRLNKLIRMLNKGAMPDEGEGLIDEHARDQPSIEDNEENQNETKPKEHNQVNKYSDISQLLKTMPKTTVPKEEESWDTYYKSANKWLSEHASGKLISTIDKEGDTYSVKFMRWQERDGGWGIVWFNQSVRKPLQLNIHIRSGYENLANMRVSLPNDQNIEVSSISCIISDPEVYRMLEQGKKEDWTYTINGIVEGIELKSKTGRYDMQSDYELEISLERNPMIKKTDKKMILLEEQ